MAAYGEKPIRSQELLLNSSEVEQFQVGVIWPSINHFWNRSGNFATDSLPGDSVYSRVADMSRRLPVVIALEANCAYYPNEFEIDDTESRTVSYLSRIAVVTVEVQCKDARLTSGMIGIAKSEMEKGGVDLSQSTDEDFEDISAWRVREFSFSTDPDESVGMNAYYILKDEVNAPYWHISDAGLNVPYAEDDVILDDEEQKKLWELERMAAANLTAKDKELILRALTLITKKPDIFS